MALPDSVKQITGTPLVLANTDDYSPTQGQPARTDQLSLYQLAADGNYTQSDKIDLGVNRDILYSVDAYIEWHSAPTAGGTVDLYIGYSSTSTIGSDNMAGLTGAAGVYNGYGAAATDADESIKQLDYIGSLVATADAAVQGAHIGYFMSRDRYAQIVVANESSVALANTDSVETCVIITPIEHQIQD